MKPHTGSNFYDDEAVFDRYSKKRKRLNSPNELIEKPIIKTLTADISGNVLDLGCGYGDLAPDLLKRGAKHYTGIDASEKMIAQAKSQYQRPEAEFHQSSLENWNYQSGKFDWVIARLVLHYIEDLGELFRKVYKTLKPNGRLLFSVEHPILTSSMDLPKPKGKKQSWIVDQYFSIGERQQNWMENKVIKYHRNLEEYWRLMAETGFRITEIREGKPEAKHFPDEEEYKRRMRIPLFLIIKAVKL